MAISPNDIRNIAVVGHRGVGKTALVEAMLYLSKALPKMGKQGAWAGGFDATAEEQAHIATLEARPVSLRWHDKKINVIDTPGDTSFFGQTRLALTAVDAAILLVSAKDGIQSGTERLFRWVREGGIPTLIVVTKVDDEHANADEVIESIRKVDSHIVQMVVPNGKGLQFKGVVAAEHGVDWAAPDAPGSSGKKEIQAELKDAVTKARAKLVDDVAAADDKLTERYLEAGDLTAEELNEGVRKSVAGAQLMPVYLVTSVQPAGVGALLDAIVEICPSPAASKRGAPVDGPPSAFIVKTHLDPHAGRTSWLRVFSGKLERDVNLQNVTQNQTERIGAMFEMHGSKLDPTTEGVAGDIIAIGKLKSSKAGDTLCDPKNPIPGIDAGLPSSVFSRAFQVENRAQEEKLAQALQLLAEEDPTIALSHEGVVNGMLVNGVGAMHLDVTAERVRRMTGIQVKMGPPRIPYRETFTKKVMYVEGKQKKQSGGHGQFGVCYIDLEPMPRGTGFEFEDAIVGGVIPRQWIPSVEKGVRKALAGGVLAGYQVVDVKVRVVDGKYHSVDSSDAAFQVAGRKAILAAAAQAKPALLEPVMKVEVKVPSENLGDVMGDLTSRGGRVLSTDSAGDFMVVNAHVPMSAMLEYEPKLTAMSSGRGNFTMQFDHYDLVPPQNQEKIVAESGFKAVDED